MKSYYSSSGMSSTFPNPSKYFSSESSNKQQLLIRSGSSGKTSDKSNGSYVNSLLPSSLFNGSGGTSDNRPSSSGGLGSNQKTVATGSRPSSSQQSFLPSASSAKLSFNSNNMPMASSPPVGMLLTRDRRSSSCNDVMLSGSEGLSLAGSSSRNLSTGSSTMNQSATSSAKKVRFSINLVTFTPHAPARPPGSPLVSCLKGGAAAHAATMRSATSAGSASTDSSSGSGSTCSSPATQSPPTVAKDGTAPVRNSNKSLSADSSHKDSGDVGGSLGYSTFESGSSSIGGSVGILGIADSSNNINRSSPSISTQMSLNFGTTSSNSSSLTGGNSISGNSNSSAKLIPVYSSPKPTPKRLLVEKQSSSSSLMASSASSSSSTSSPIASTANAVSSMSSAASTVDTENNADLNNVTQLEAPVAALVAKSVSISNFVSNNQTSIRFFSTKVEFSVTTHPQLFDKSFIAQSSQPLTCVTLQYADMTGISIAGTKLRFKIPRKCTPFGANFEPDASLFQFAIDLNSVVSSSIVKQKVMPLICPVMFGGSR